MQTVNRFKKRNNQGGYVILLIVLVTGAVASAITSSLLLFGVDASKNAFAKEQSKQARAMTDGCAEEALEQIRAVSGFTGYGTLTLSSQTCSYNVTNTGGTNRLIIASSTVGTTVRKVRITIDKVKPIRMTSWQEVADF
jgi:hypothetical protein